MKAELDEIRNRIDIVDLVNEDCPLERHGDEYIGWDRKHPSESKTSLTVSRSKQVFHCFNCGAGGDVFSWLMHFKGMSFPEAVNELAQRAGVVLAGVDEVERRRQEQIYNDRKALAPLLLAAAEFYHGQLIEEHIAYAREKWGFTRETLEKFKIGYSPPGRSMLFWHLNKKGFDKGLLAKSGLFYQEGDYLNDFFRGRLMFPYWNNNQVVYFIGRWVEGCPDERDEPKYRKQMVHNRKRPYISPAISNGWFYGEDTAYGAENLIISEGVGDCIAALQAGFSCISPVTVRFRKEDYSKILKLAKKAERVFICNDQEKSQAGTKGALATAEYLESNSVRVGIITLPQAAGQGKIDLAEYLRDNSPGSLQQLIGESKTIWEVKAGALERTGNRVEDLRRVGDFAKNELASCDALIRQAVVTGVLKERFELTQDEVNIILGNNAAPVVDDGSNTSKSEYHLTDRGNAERFADDHRGDVLHDHSRGMWYIWNGKYWPPDNTGVIVLKAKDTLDKMYSEALEASDVDKRKALINHTLKSESEPKIRAMINLAKSEPEIPIDYGRMDADEFLLNVLNGTINLKTGELQPHRKEDFITKLAPVEFDPKAECPLFEAFIDRIMDGDEEKKWYLQKAIGYSLTGSNREQGIFIPHGTGKNGKTTFIEAYRNILGDYAQDISVNSLMVKKYDGGIPNDIARLRDARFVVTTEADTGRRLSESLIKQLTGGDVMQARFMRSEWFSFIPKFKLWMGTNHKPEIRGTDEGIWRRINLIPFNVTIPEEERDKELADKLKVEYTGILNWAITGCIGWLKEGLNKPPEVAQANECYRHEMDNVGRFLDECCKTTLPDASVKAGSLFKSYTEWCSQEGEEPISQKRFGMSLKERGFNSDSGSGNVRIWKGIGLVYKDASRNS